MRTISMMAPAVATCAATCLATANAQDTSNPSPTSPAAADSAAPAVAEQAERLRRMAGYVGSAQQFTFHADITFDHVLPSEQKLQFSAVEDVAQQRPAGLYVKWTGDLGDRQFWYDGKSVTLNDPSTPFCASEAAPPELNSMPAAKLHYDSAVAASIA